jgi:hypothetical protein
MPRVESSSKPMLSMNPIICPRPRPQSTMPRAGPSRQPVSGPATRLRPPPIKPSAGQSSNQWAPEDTPARVPARGRSATEEDDVPFTPLVDLPSASIIVIHNTDSECSSEFPLAQALVDYDSQSDLLVVRSQSVVKSKDCSCAPIATRQHSDCGSKSGSCSDREHALVRGATESDSEVSSLLSAGIDREKVIVFRCAG